jgi:serine protease Do
VIAIRPTIASCKSARVLNWQIAVCIFQFAVVASVAAQQADTLADREEAALRTAAERVADSVVQIRTIGGLDTAGSELRADGPTTGLIISPDGYIITSAFNCAQQPASIVVTFASGKQAPAEQVATDDSRMLVLLKVHEAGDLPVPPMAPVDQIRVGQWAVAIGRTFRADRVNVSVGIVSATGRMFGRVLQTDANVSTANYGGPLVDIRGRVLGVIVPMAPQASGGMAGAEWYDSGIGFAVPLAAIGDALERMKNGKDQRAGILGIGLAGKDANSSPAELAAVRPDSPAGMAGLKKGDQIIEVDGRPIKTQKDLRFALGPRYAGETVRLVAKRGDEQIEKSIELAGKLKAFRHGFLGILPMRARAQVADNKARKEGDQKADAGANADNNEGSGESATDDDKENKVESGHKNDREEFSGVVVRMVYTGSPAAVSGIVAGDSVVRINNAEIDTIDDAIAEMNNISPGGDVAVSARRGNEAKEFKLKADRAPTNVPEQLPPAWKAENEAGKREGGVGGERREADENGKPDSNGKVNEDGDNVAGGQPREGKTRTLKLPEFKESCEVYEPVSREGSPPRGMLLWLLAPGDADAQAIITAWQPICDRDGLILVVPRAADADRWDRTELEYLRRLVEQVVRQYVPDARRIVVCGQGGGGAMAWHLGLANRGVFTGVAALAAPLPRQVRVPENEPAQRLAVICGLSGDESVAAQMSQGLAKLAEAGYPVTTLTIRDRSGRLAVDEREELARWIDTLDRF